MSKMKVWEFEEEWYVAESAADAKAARIEATGPCDEYDDDDATEVPGDRVLGCTFEARSDVPKWVPESSIVEAKHGHCRVDLTANDWAAGNGRGYLMGLNW